jgi:hypothetical protein
MRPAHRQEVYDPAFKIGQARTHVNADGGRGMTCDIATPVGPVANPIF